MLEINNLSAGYQKETPILQNFSMRLKQGERIGITGQNGTGKSTLVKAIMGLIPCCSGEVMFEGKNILYSPAYDRVKMGIAFFMQGGRVYRDLSVQENLILAGTGRQNFNFEEELYTLGLASLPLLKNKQRRRIPAGNLSGGERHLLAFSMVLIACPEMKLLIADEPSAGVAQKAQLEILEIINNALSIKRTGLLLIEQNVNFLNKLAQSVINLKS